MRRFIDCDQVFDVLTRGPFPSGADSDEAVESHLRACHECRQLAEALQPAVALFQESISNAAGEGLPVYQGRLFRGEASTARVRSLPEVLSATEFVHPTASSRAAWPMKGSFATSVRFVAATALVMTLAMLGWGFAGTLQKSLDGRKLIPEVIAGQRHQPSERGLAALTSLKLSQVCFSAEVKRPATADSPPLVAYVCCTRCHNEAKPGRPEVRSIAKLQDSCSACHEKS